MIPVDDLVMHDAEDCACGVLLVPIVAGDGIRHDMTIHRRLDGRGEGDEPHPTDPGIAELFD